MTSRFKTYQNETSLKVVLHDPFKGWGKFTLAAYFLTAVACCWILIDQVILDMIARNDFLIIVLVVIATILLLYILILRTVLRNANEYEILILIENNFILQKGLWLFKSSKQFNVNEIEELKYLDEKEKVDHPLKTEPFDYLGFQTEQKVIDEFFKDDRIAFSYKGKKYSFGKDIMSWEFEELLTLIQTKIDFDLSSVRIK